MEPLKRVAIVGFASSSRELAPFKDESVEIWSLNHAWTWIPRWTRWFEIHPLDHVKKDLPRDGVFQSGASHFEWLAKQDPNKPIYMWEHHAEIPGSVAFPYAQINEWLVNRFGCEPDYFTSSISYMIAIAMAEGFSEIGLYGIDLLNTDEYYYQRAGAEYLIGLARGMGIRVVIPKESALCKANYIYGKSEPPEQQTGAARVSHAKKINGTLEEELRKTLAHYHTFDGAHQAWRMALDYIRRLRTPVAVVDMEKQFEHTRVEREKWLSALKHVEGGLNVSTSFVSWLSHEARGGVLDAGQAKS